MAYNGGGYVPPGSVFGGFAGGYSQTPEGLIIAPNTNAFGLGQPRVPGANLPSVDPNNYPGMVHFGPPTTIIGQPLGQPSFNAGYIDPNLGLMGAANYNAGF